MRFCQCFQGVLFRFFFQISRIFLIISRCSWVNLSENVYVKILLLALIEKFSKTCNFCLITADRPVYHGWFHCIGCFEMLAAQWKRELQNEKFLPKAGLEPTTSALLDWRSNRLSYGDFWLRILKGNLYNIGIRYTYFLVVKSDRLLDHALQC